MVKMIICYRCGVCIRPVRNALDFWITFLNAFLGSQPRCDDCGRKTRLREFKAREREDDAYRTAKAAEWGRQDVQSERERNSPNTSNSIGGVPSMPFNLKKPPRSR